MNKIKITTKNPNKIQMPEQEIEQKIERTLIIAMLGSWIATTDLRLRFKYGPTLSFPVWVFKEMKTEFFFLSGFNWRKTETILS